MKTNRILIVDDKEENRYLLQTLLTGHGYDVDSAVHGADALTKAKQNPPDMIIADILMPVMDGFALCRAWKKDERLKAIPFIFYTATYTDDRDRAFALSLGADYFITKPAEPSVFIETIKDAFRQMEKVPQAGVSSSAAAHENETIYLKQYNEVLIRKLETKMEELGELNAHLEKKVAERTAQLKDAVASLEELNRVFVGRELKMSELKARISELEKIIENGKNDRNRQNDVS